MELVGRQTFQPLTRQRQRLWIRLGPGHGFTPDDYASRGSVPPIGPTLARAVHAIRSRTDIGPRRSVLALPLLVATIVNSHARAPSPGSSASVSAAVRASIFTVNAST